MDIISKEENKSFLQGIVNEVENLVINQTNRESFRLVAERFYKEWTKWTNAESAYKQQIRNYIEQARASKDPKLPTLKCANKSCLKPAKLCKPEKCPYFIAEPPIPGYVFEEGCWIPYIEKPICPALRLTGDIRAKNDQEALNISYALLWIIHDWLGESYAPIYRKPPTELALFVGCDFNLSKDKQKPFIQNAFDRVKNDSDSKQHAEQEPKEASGGEAEAKTEPPNRNDEAYIPYTKAIEFSNGILTRKKLDKAIKQGEPLKARDKKPSEKRRCVHIQDVLSLINKLSVNEKAAEQAARMFGEYKEQLQKKMTRQVNLD